MLKRFFLFLIIFSSLIVTVGCRKTNVPQPKQLENIESNSEDIMDDISKNDWVKAQNRIDLIKTNMTELKPILVSASVKNSIINGITSAIANLKKEVNAKKSFKARVQANQITRYVPDIADYYKVDLPTDIGRLDYLSREIILNAETKDWTSVNSNYEKAETVWERLKTKFNSKYKKDIASFQSSLDKIEKYINQKDTSLTIKEANTLLDKVDILEVDYKKQNNG